MKRKEELIKMLEEIPEELIDKAYSLDIVQGTLQLSYDKEINSMFPFVPKDSFFVTTLFNGVKVTMEEPPYTKVYYYEG